MTPRAFITGIGVVSPLGLGARQTCDAIGRGETAGAPLSVFDASAFTQPCGGQVHDFPAREYFRVTKAIKLTDRPTRFAVAAARLALDDAGWSSESCSSEGLGVVLGCSGSDLQAAELGRALRGVSPEHAGDTRLFARHVLNGLNPLWLLVNLPNMSSAHVAIQCEARGPNSTVMSDWAAGVQAIGEAFEWIRAGEADAVLTGGADSGLTPFAYAAYQQAGLFASAEPYLPAEGAAVLLLERDDHARSRGACIKGEVLAYASAVATSDEPSDLAAALASTFCQAMTQTGWHAGDLAALALAAPRGGALGSSLPHALTRAFGRSAPLERVVTFEPSLGHALAAAGPLDLALTLVTRRVGVDRPGILCSAMGLSGQAVTLAVRAGDVAPGLES